METLYAPAASGVFEIKIMPQPVGMNMPEGRAAYCVQQYHNTGGDFPVPMIGCLFIEPVKVFQTLEEAQAALAAQ